LNDINYFSSFTGVGGFEREEEYYKIATERIKHYQKQEVL
jgi:hypothetical protein